MDGMDGMDMSMSSSYTPGDKLIARILWYIVVTTVGILAVRRSIDYIRLRSVKGKQTRTIETPVHISSSGVLAGTYDAVVTIFREAAYPQPAVFTGRIARYFTPPSLGKCLFLATYWSIILTMLWSNVIQTSSSRVYASRWEIVGFRAAWVTVTQFPLLYLLAGKFNLISLLTGISYERLNWFHRWVARTMFLTAIVHWSFFFREWSIADFVSIELQVMPMVKWGFASWGVLGWMVLSSFGILRSRIYEVWVLQHVVGAVLMLWLVHTHVPDYAKYNVYMAIGFVGLDRLVRAGGSLWRNVHWSRRSEIASRSLGFNATAQTLSDDHLYVVLENVNFQWKAGQHIYLSIPSLGPLESHPFTIANTPVPSVAQGGQSLELLIKVHQGITRRLQKKCLEASSNFKFQAFINGPWGQPPDPARFDSLVLLATGSGASFVIPILSQAVQAGGTSSSISLTWVTRGIDHVKLFHDRLQESIRVAESRGIRIRVRIHVTGEVFSEDDSDEALEWTKSGDVQIIPEKDDLSRGSTSSQNRLLSSSDGRPTLEVRNGRPSLENIILPVVEEALGETGILACGNAGFLGEIRNYTATLSDDRAVHKGSGAQGIYLFTESRNW